MCCGRGARARPSETRAPVHTVANTYNYRGKTAVKQKCCVEVEEHGHLLLLLCIHPNIHNCAKRRNKNKISESFRYAVVGKGLRTPNALVLYCVKHHPGVSKCTFFPVQPQHRFSRVNAGCFGKIATLGTQPGQVKEFNLFLVNRKQKRIICICLCFRISANHEPLASITLAHCVTDNMGFFFY